MSWIDEWLAASSTSFAKFAETVGPENAVAPDGHMVPPVFAAQMTAEYVTATIPVSLDLLMDEGVIPDTRPKTMRKPPSRRERFRMSRSRWRRSVAEWLYELISGEELPEEEW